jgi:hypothetical protein
MSEWPKSFKTAVCEHYRCAPEAYVRKAFAKALYRRAWLLLPLLRFFMPRWFFSLDYALIDEVGDAQDWNDFNSAVSMYVESNALRSGFLRRTCKLRVSCQRLKRMARGFFGERAVPPAGEKSEKSETTVSS